MGRQTWELRGSSTDLGQPEEAGPSALAAGRDVGSGGGGSRARRLADAGSGAGRSRARWPA